MLAGLLLVVATAAPQPSAAGFIAFDPLWERVVLGRPPVAGAATESAAPIMRGKFVEESGALRLVEPAPYGENTWISQSTIESGLVRARFVVGAKLDTAVLVRAEVDDVGELKSGYGISVERDRLRLFRWEHKVPRYLGVEAKYDAPARGGVLELVVTLAGPAITATLYDGGSFQTRAHVAVHDRWAAKGKVGLRMRGSQDQDSGVSLLSVGRADGTDLGNQDLGAGVERLLVIDESDVALLPADLRAKVVSIEKGSAFLVTDPIGHERVLRASVRPRAHKAQMPWKYIDPAVRAQLGKAPTRTAGGFRVDESYKDAIMVEVLLRAYAERFPKIARLVDIGRSHEGRTIWALKISDHPELEEDEPAVMLDGAHHGGELMSIEFVIDAVQQLLERYASDAWTRNAVDSLEIWCVPLVNVDGNMRYIHETRDYDRKNARDVDGNGKIDGWDGVDLYRNYPVRWGGLGEIGSRSNPFHYRYRGPGPGTEPEVQAIMGLAARERFVASIDFHTNATKILVPYTDPSMKNPVLNEAWTVAEEIVAELPTQVNGQKYTVARNLYPVDGTCQDWLRFSFGTVALLVEGPTNNPMPYARGRPGAVVGTRGTWVKLLQRVMNGPGVAGHVRDAAGNPIEAEVVIDEMKTVEGELWTSRPRDGRFQRMLPRAGTYTLRVRYNGMERTQRVTVGAGETKRVDVIVANGGGAPSE